MLCTWISASGGRDGKRQLHLFDIYVGWVLLAKKGYAGTMDELRLLAGTFDECVRALFPVSASLPEALPAPRAEGRKGS